MESAMTLRGPRVLLRPWRTDDLAAFAQLNADPAVMEYFPSVLDTEQSDDLAKRIQAGFENNGFGFWALEIPSVLPFAGFVGLSVPGSAGLPFMPTVEIGWRLCQQAWGKGYASEAARVVLAHAFTALKLPEVVAFTTLTNQRSQAVMQRIGLSYAEGEDFMHPALPADHPLRHHVLYRVRYEDWLKQQ